MTKSDQNEIMKFGDFLKILKVFYGSELSQKEFVELIVDNSTIYDDENSVCPIFDIDERSKNRYFVGERNLTKKLASDLMKHISKPKFSNFLKDNLNEDLFDALSKEFLRYIPHINSDNIFDEITNLFSNIIIADAKGRKVKVETKIDDIKLDLSEQLIILMKNIEKFDDENNIETILNYDPLTLKEKISDNKRLQRKIMSYVSGYYNYLKDLFRNETMIGTLNFEQISKSMKSHYLRIKLLNLSNEETFEKMIDWIKGDTLMERSTCEILVSFFIQNCEVFDATS